jgi:hypothetical protein
MAESARNSPGIPTWGRGKRRYVKEVREILWPTATYCVRNDLYPMGPYFRRSFWNPLVFCAALSILAVEILWVFRRSISVRQSVLQLFGGSQTKGVVFWWCSIEWKLRICREMVSRLYIEHFFFYFPAVDFFPLRQRWRLKGKILRKYIMVIVGNPTQPRASYSTWMVLTFCFEKPKWDNAMVWITIWRW